MPKKKYVHPVHLLALADRYSQIVDEHVAIRHRRLRELTSAALSVEQRRVLATRVEKYEARIADLRFRITALRTTADQFVKDGDGDVWRTELDDFDIPLAVNRWKPSARAVWLLSSQN